MNLNHLAIFHAVAEEGNISRAAERLMISQPAVSKQLRLLERSLSATLFDREPRGVRLTEAGRLLATYAARIFALEAEAQRALGELSGLQRGRLAIGASTTIGVYLLPELFVQFRKRFPAIDVTLEVASSRTVQQRLVDRAIDIGFTEMPIDEDSLEAKCFMSDQLVAIVPPRHRLLRARRVTAEAFCREPFVVRATGSETRSFVERALLERGLSFQPVMSLGSTEAIKRAVAAGIGVAIVSGLSIGLELRAKTLRTLSIAGLNLSRPLFQVLPKESTRSAALAAFVELVKTSAKQPDKHS